MHQHFTSMWIPKNSQAPSRNLPNNLHEQNFEHSNIHFRKYVKCDMLCLLWTSVWVTHSELGQVQDVPKSDLSECCWSHSALAQSQLAGTSCVWKLIFWSFLTKTKPVIRPFQVIFMVKFNPTKSANRARFFRGLARFSEWHYLSYDK